MPRPTAPRRRPPLPSSAPWLLAASLALVACEQADPCDGVDNDGDGYFDEDLEEGEYKRPFFTDADGDGFGELDFVVDAPIWACAAPPGRVSNNLDCDDTDADVNPDALESCNDIDDDCDGTVDRGVGETFFADEDGDGHGDADAPVVACEQPSDAVVGDDDCDDADPDTYPGATELCDGVDNDCDGDLPADELDGDGDGYLACADCDDGDAAIHPGAYEICDGIDANCDGAVDDADHDGLGTPDCEEALVVVSYPFAQVADLCPATLEPYPDVETLAVVDAIASAGLSALLVVEDELDGLQDEELEERPVVVVLNGGLPWGAGFFNDTLAAMQRAQGEGIPLYVIGDDAADQLDVSATLPEVLGLEDFAGSGAAGTLTPVDADHPVLLGPAGVVGALDVDVDVDVTSARAGATVVLAQDGTDAPALVLLESPAPTAVQLFGVASAWDTCPVGPDADSEILIRNVLDWLIQ